VMHPDNFGVVGSDNANSLVLGLEYEGRRVLLTGDLESPGLDWLLEQEPYQCDLLAAPHHGSQRSDPPGLAEWCKPGLVVLSSGSAHEATEAAYRAYGASVESTHDGGMVTVRLRAEKVLNQCYFEGK
jgi:competence protein ComEC